MHKFFRRTVQVLTFCGILFSPVVNAKDRPGPAIEQIIVKMKKTTAKESLLSLSEAAGISLSYFRKMSGGADVLKLPNAKSRIEAEVIAERISKLKSVEYAHPDYWRHHHGQIQPTIPASLLPRATTPNDTHYNVFQWALKAAVGGIYMPSAWDITTGDADIVVAVLDTGILPHADLVGRYLAGYDMINTLSVANDGDLRDADPVDSGDWVALNECYAGSPARNSSWHGTHVSGTIGAASDNNSGVAGVNWNSLILPVRVLGKCGGFTSDIVDGITWAAGLNVAGVADNANPAKVINMSLGGDGACSVSEQNAITAAITAGSTVVVSAGNDGEDLGTSPKSPAVCNNVITVASTGRDGQLAYYSNYGASIEVSAPGGDQSSAASDGILSTYNTGTTVALADAYSWLQGTSMAAPHVSGVVSLMYSVAPTLTPAQVLSNLQAAVYAFPTGTGADCDTSICGTGIVQTLTTLTSLQSNVTVTAINSTATRNPLTLGSYAITRTGSTAAEIRVGYTLSGTAANGTDYRRLSGEAIISAGQSSTVVSLEPLASASSSSVAATVTLAAGTGYSIANPSTASVTISNPTPSSTNRSESVEVQNLTQESALKDCPVSLALRGTKEETALASLRHFRDQVLMQTPAGRELVAQYYSWAPQVSEFLIENSWAKRGFYLVLKPWLPLFAKESHV